jgi:uncharacterized protein (DUF1499 family)
MTMRSFATVTTIALLASTEAFVQFPQTHKSTSTLAAHKSRSDFLQQASLAIGGLLLGSSLPANADDAVPSISACKPQGGGKPINCVSTSSVKQVDCYVAPWTFECSAAEAQARLKGVFVADSMTYSELYEEKNYLRVSAARGLATDQLEFVFDEKDKFVKLRSADASDAISISDFGANRRRMDGIRKAANIFDVMGGSYDSIENRGTGPLGQLKSFYGLQSGGGFEDLYKD